MATKPGSKLDHATCTEAYKDAEAELHALIHNIRTKLGGNFDDYLCQAQEAFMLAWRAPIQNGCKGWKQHWRKWVWFKLYDTRRTSLSRMQHHVRDGHELATNGHAPAPTPYDIYEELSPDALYVADLIANMPPELLAQVQARGGRPRSYRPVLREHLLWLGWEPWRIENAFDEITEAVAASPVVPIK